MKSEKKRIDILEKGAGVILVKGFNNTGINEILIATNTPKGSFYHYFKNKEDFGLQLVSFFLNKFLIAADQQLAMEHLPYLIRLRNFLDIFLNIYENNNYSGGCPIGNLSLEMSDLNENFRIQIKNSIDTMQKIIESFLLGAQNNSEISKNLDLKQISAFFINSWEGALLRIKVEKNPKPMHLFYDFVFDLLLKPTKI